MNTNNKKKRKNIAAECLKVTGILILLTLAVSIWPILVLVIIGTVVWSVRQLFPKPNTANPVIPAKEAECGLFETEFSGMQKSFGELQKQITEQINRQYPGAKWVWGDSDSFGRFSRNEPLTVFLNGAGGYAKARVILDGLVFSELRYITAETSSATSAAADKQSKAKKGKFAGNSNISESDETELPENAPVNYSRIAFDWTESNIVGINSKYNEIIGQNATELLIPAADLPHPDSWSDVRAELIRGGFTSAEPRGDGITVSINTNKTAEMRKGN